MRCGGELAQATCACLTPITPDFSIALSNSHSTSPREDVNACLARLDCASEQFNQQPEFPDRNKQTYDFYHLIIDGIKLLIDLIYILNNWARILSGDEKAS